VSVSELDCPHESKSEFCGFECIFKVDLRRRPPQTPLRCAELGDLPVATSKGISYGRHMRFTRARRHTQWHSPDTTGPFYIRCQPFPKVDISVKTLISFIILHNNQLNLTGLIHLMLSNSPLHQVYTNFK
jgi:hypothetical protein